MAKGSTNKHGPSIKNSEAYEALRDKGYGKAKAAAIANAQANDNMAPSRNGGKSPPYEEWTVDDLQARAREVDLEGRSTMVKSELINALRAQ